MNTSKAYDICLEMFEQRGYEIVEQDDERILAIKEDGNQICAFISKNMTKFNVDRIQEYISMIKKMDIWHCLIVYKDSATPIAKKVVEDSKEIIIELFNEDELQYNITKHFLVPLHELLYKKKTKECEAFKKKYSDKFPIILKTDPIARFYFYDKGDIIRITRKDGYITYRIVK
jgi:DNA-directed RNA polymerase I, II, and III subunit RPABC1